MYASSFETTAAVITIDTTSPAWTKAHMRWNLFQAKMPGATLVRWNVTDNRGIQLYLVASESDIFSDHNVYVYPNGTYSCFCKWGTQKGQPKGYCLHIAGVYQHINQLEAFAAQCEVQESEEKHIGTLAAGQPEDVLVIEAGPGKYGTMRYWIEKGDLKLGYIYASSWNANQGANWSAYSYLQGCVVTGASDRAAQPKQSWFRDRTTQVQAISDVLVANGLPALGAGSNSTFDEANNLRVAAARSDLFGD